MGVLVDRGADDDAYREGPADRRNDFATVQPQTTCEPAVPGVGVFSDGA